VIRAALPRLKQWKSLMHTYISFGTPHLGCTNNSSTLVKTGLKLFTKITGHTSLNQMNLSDASDLKNCYLFRLSNYDVNCLNL
jgi:hypothetical protein